MDIAVMGATGNIGTELVDLLTDGGHSVRLLSSKGEGNEDGPDSQTSFAVDLNDGPSLREALNGAEGAFMLSGYDDNGLVEEMERAGVGRVVLLSSGSVGSDASPENAVMAYHLASERALEESGLTWTFLRPNTFMANSLKWADAIRDGDPVKAPFADVPVACNDPRDVANVAAVSLTSDGHGGKAYRLSGPEALLPATQVEILGEVLGREISFEAQDDETARAEMEDSMPQEYVDAFFEFFADGKIDETTVRPTVREVTGQEPRSFREWAEAHKGGFGYSTRNRVGT